MPTPREELIETARAVLAEFSNGACIYCRGTGKTDNCRYCGDSTYDHDCEPPETCTRCHGAGASPAVLKLRSLVSEESFACSVCGYAGDDPAKRCAFCAQLGDAG